MRRARFDLEEQVGGLVREERYELRRHGSPEAEHPAWQEPRRPLKIRADRVSEPHAA